MKRNLLITAAVAAALAIPLSVQANDTKASGSAKDSSATTGTSASGSSSAGSSKSSGGAEDVFKSLDRNNDGFLSRDEAKGTPHEIDFVRLDKNGDGKLSPAEHAALAGDAQPASAGASSNTGSSSSATGNGISGTKDSPSGGTSSQKD
jgi:hypothetical protein